MGQRCFALTLVQRVTYFSEITSLIKAEHISDCIPFLQYLQSVNEMLFQNSFLTWVETGEEQTGAAHGVCVLLDAAK